MRLARTHTYPPARHHRDATARRWGKNALATLGNIIQRVTSAPVTLPPLEPADRERFMELQNQSAAVFGGSVDASKVEFSFCDTAEDAQDAANDDDLKAASQEDAASDDDDVQMGATRGARRAAPARRPTRRRSCAPSVGTTPSTASTAA